MPYTWRDTPDVVARVEHDLGRIQAVVRRADGHLRALVLTGGFARGEGALLDGRPQNDYDLVAVRGLGRPRVPYADLQGALEADLGVHVDLAPMPAWRFRFPPRTVFWYELALRGRVLWGDPVLETLRAPPAKAIERAEGIRLLSNRAAGLLLYAGSSDDNEVRIQASKAFLAVVDAFLLAHGQFAPSQRERRPLWDSWLRGPDVPPRLEELRPWFDWAYRFKMEPAATPPADPESAWSAARRAILSALPFALHRAGVESMAAHARGDSWLAQAAYWKLAPRVPGARRLVLNPAGRVRAATIALLERTPARRAPDWSDAPELRRFGEFSHAPLRVLEGLRGATLQ